MRKFYVQNGVTVSHEGGQDNTDLGKAIEITKRRQAETSSLAVSSISSSPLKHNVFILGGLGGRVDQGLSVLHALFYYDTICPELRLWLFSEASITFILFPGGNIIETPLSSGIVTPNVGILPLLGPSTITTSGLEWDVHRWLTRIGGHVSTSNHLLADEIMVETTEKILFTIELSDSLTFDNQTQ